MAESTLEVGSGCSLEVGTGSLYLVKRKGYSSASERDRQDKERRRKHDEWEENMGRALPYL